MLDGAVNQDFLARIDGTQQAAIAKLLADKTFDAPTVASFAMGELSVDDVQAKAYSSNNT